MHSVSHIICSCDTHSTHVLTTLHTVTHNLLLSHMVLRCHGLPVSQAHDIIHVIFLMSHTQLQALRVTHDFTQSHSAYHTIHRVTQPRTHSGVTHNLTVVHTHTVSWWHTPSPVSPTDAHSVSLLSAHLRVCTQSSVLFGQSP